MTQKTDIPISTNKPKSNEWFIRFVLRWSGYCLLALTLFDVIGIFVPLRFTDSAWEYQMIGSLVERVPVPLIGLALVLLTEKNVRILRVLSVASVVIGVLYLLLIPLAVSNTVLINRKNYLQITTQVNQQLTQFQQFENQLNKATTAQDVNNLAAFVYGRGRTPDIKDPQQLKSQLSSEVTKAKAAVKAKSEATQANTRLSLIKSSVKWILGSLVSGVLFISISRATSKLL